MTRVLEVRGLTAGYGAAPVIRDVDLAVDEGEVVCLLGPNGAGKTTTMLALAGEVAPSSGTVELDGARLRGPLHRRARRGMSYVTEERSVLMGLTVHQNLQLAGVPTDAVLELFPELDDLMGRRAGLLSGGEQQMLTLGRALARRPRLLLADELSLGLAPLVVDRLLAAVRTAVVRDGAATVLVEQHARKALQYADRVYVMRRGQVTMVASAAEATSRIGEIEDHYLAQTS